MIERSGLDVSYRTLQWILSGRDIYSTDSYLLKCEGVPFISNEGADLCPSALTSFSTLITVASVWARNL
jgi:hypothetical protein